MPAPRIRRELGMVLAAEEPRMVGELDHLAEVTGDRALGPRAHDEPRGFEPRQIMVVDLIAMTMSLRHGRRSIDAVRERPRHHVAGLRSESHGSAEIGLSTALLD